MGEKPVRRVEIIISRETGGVISAFERAIGMSNNSIQTAIKRNANLKDDTLNKILKAYPQYSALWLLTGEGEMLNNPDTFIVQSPQNFESKSPAVITVDHGLKDNILLVPQAVQAGYLAGGFSEPAFMQNLPTYRMPGLTNGIFRMFEVKGNSMFPTIPAKSYVVGQFVENWAQDIKDNQIYVIVSNEVDDGMVKRCINRIEKYNNLLCKSDNRRDYPTQNINPESIKEVWEVKLHLNFTLPDPADLYDRMNDLEAELQEIKRHLVQ